MNQVDLSKLFSLKGSVAATAPKIGEIDLSKLFSLKGSVAATAPKIGEIPPSAPNR